jgi:hypothetical protein
LFGTSFLQHPSLFADSICKKGEFLSQYECFNASKKAFASADQQGDKNSAEARLTTKEPRHSRGSNARWELVDVSTERELGQGDFFFFLRIFELTCAFPRQVLGKSFNKIRAIQEEI